ncbi:MAG: phosphoribosyltransferase [Flavobacteriales bacterium]|nr:phosphoribosyltransferase [Flavobacteriales bacterium]
MQRNYFIDRTEAGALLAKELEAYRSTDALVLAIPRGGVAVGHAVAIALDLPLDIVLAKKIGHPMNPEYAIGAVSPEAVSVEQLPDVPASYVEHEVTRIRAQMQERAHQYRGQRPPPRMKDRTLIVVDDGVATGHTLLAILGLLRKQQPARIVVAMPVVPASFVRKARIHADEFVCLLAPHNFRAVGQFYEDFMPVENDEVVHLLNHAWRERPS